MFLQIYIVREQTFCEVDGALGLLTLDAGAGHQKSGKLIRVCIFNVTEYSMNHVH